MEDGLIVHSGTINLRTSKEYCRDGDRLIKFYNFLSSVEHSPFDGVSLGMIIDEVVYEEVKAGFGGSSKGFHSSAKANKLYYNLQGIVEMYAAMKRIPEYRIHVSTLKKAFTGDGRATKEMMAEEAEKLGWKGGVWKGGQILNHDEVDAIALLFVHGQKQGYNVRFAVDHNDPAPQLEDCF